MADEEKLENKKRKKEIAKPVVPRTAVDLQRLQYEKLMKDPVSLDIFFRILLPT